MHFRVESSASSHNECRATAPFFRPASTDLSVPELLLLSSESCPSLLSLQYNFICSSCPVCAFEKKKKEEKSHIPHARSPFLCKKKKYVYPHFSSSTRTNSCEELLFFFFSMFLTFATCALFHTMMVKIEKKTAERICALLKKKNCGIFI